MLLHLERIIRGYYVTTRHFPYVILTSANFYMFQQTDNFLMTSF